MAQTKRHAEHAWPFFTAAARQAARERQVINLRPHFAYQNRMRSQKPFRMTSLREIDLQPSWNDILTKNIGGWGYILFSNAARRRLGCGVFANLYERNKLTSLPLVIQQIGRKIVNLASHYELRELSGVEQTGTADSSRHSSIRALLAPALEQSAISCRDVARGHGFVKLDLIRQTGVHSAKQR